MSRKTLLSRPRTRLYDANYNIGESYYKSALDRLDRKYSGRPLSPTPRNQFSPTAENIADRHARIFAEEDIETSRRRAGKHIREQNLFDSRGVMIGRRPVLDNLENDLNDETSAVIRSIRANKKSAVVDDIDLENTSSSLKSSRLLNRSEKILDSVGLNDRSIRAIEEGSYKRRPKVTFETDAEDYQKWTPVDNRVAAVHTRREEVTAVRARKEERSDRSAEIRSESSAAAMRARQSKERLNDLEEEMAVIAEKQAAREARVARLRALVAETEQESEVLERSQTAAERRAARREQLESIE